MKYIAGLYVYSEGLCLLLKIIKAGLRIESSQISHPFTKQLSDFANSSGKHMRRGHCLRNCILGFCWVMIKLMTGTFHKQLPSQGYALRHNGGKRRHLHLGHPYDFSHSSKVFRYWETDWYFIYWLFPILLQPVTLLLLSFHKDYCA